jgi:hypothetical protein
MKSFVVCLFLCLGFFVVFACGTSAPASEQTPSPEPVAPVTPAPATPAPTPPRAVTPSRATDLVLDGAETYTVVQGDTLSNISRKKYQNGFYYPIIMMASPGVVSDQDLIEPGMVLTILKLQANLNDARAKESMKRYILEIAGITDRIRPKDAAGLRKLAGEL